MKKNMNILVTGGNGQLALCIRDAASLLDSENLYRFTTSEELDIRNEQRVYDFLIDWKPDIVINCAAYTKVDNAEDDYWDAYAVNVEGVQNLVNACKEIGAYMVHISTDYVFDGRKKTPYSEDDKMHPLNQYGVTKMLGEVYPLEYKNGMVIRTSWLYSEYGKNFYKTILERIRTERDTNVICDQFGTPTYAKDLAFFIVYELIMKRKVLEKSGLYNYTNKGIASWYDFASAIETIWHNFGPYEPMRRDPMDISFNITPYSKRFIKPIPSSEYKTKAKRPSYSVLDKSKIEKEFDIKINHWMDSLLRCMKNDKKI
jgi:dTDP-4-dehydrorhamnose reductase